MVVNGIAMTRCGGCGKFVPCRPEETRCSRCGHTIPAVTTPVGFHTQAKPMDEKTANEPIDHANVGKFARIVMQKSDYYLPRFKMLKKQGKSVVSWNWAAALLSPYWFAFRKCYLWACFASVVELVGALLLSPISLELNNMISGQAITYPQMMTVITNILESNPVYMYLCYGVMLLYILRGVVFGLLGNYIYKKECLRRIDRLDAMPPEQSAGKVIRMSGVSFFAPLVVYYAISVLQNLLIAFI